jgi:hypothetical protein
MAIRKVEAEIECDGCGGLFDVDLDPAADVIGGSNPIIGLIEDTIGGMPLVSIQGDHMLCRACTTKVDDAFADDMVPSWDQVAAVLNAAAGL